MIRVWEALRIDHPMPSGRTRPLVLECVEADGDSATGTGGDTRLPLLLPASAQPTSQAPSLWLPGANPEASEPSPQPVTRLFVVKSIGHPEVREASLFFELFGNVLAREFGITTPEPALILLSPEFVAASKSVMRELGFSLHPGFGVGTEFLRGALSNPTFAARWGRSMVLSAAQLYAFDLLVQNPDRCAARPNCAVASDRLIAFDFETAFSFVYALTGAVKPWELSQNGIGRLHLFHRMLAQEDSREGINWSNFASTVEALTERRLLDLVKPIPEDWRGFTDKVIEHLLAAQEKARRLPLELAASLRVFGGG